jgi:ornithine cyclodeaminase/alanine dehydrogenase-like protein (mu-crystallin family)
MVAHLDEADVRVVLQWDELIPCMEIALVAFSIGRVQQPVRTCLRSKRGNAT